MPALQVRNFPDELYEELREHALREHRSIAQETVVAVRRHLVQQDGSTDTVAQDSIHMDRVAKRRVALQRVAMLPEFDVPDSFTPIAELIREDRDSR